VTVKINRALISVSNKIGIVKFAEVLQKFGIEIISTGGTYNKLTEAGIKALKVEELTNFPEMLDGRLKTLHPFVHGAILADRSKDEHIKQILDAGMKLIDMVVVNLYPFKETISMSNVTLEEAIENIDIGGPAMIRSAAKNHKSVAVVIDPEDYERIADELASSGGAISNATLFSLSIKAFQHTCEYDSVIFNYLVNRLNEFKETEYKNTRVYVRPYIKIDYTKSEDEFIVETSADALRNSEGDFASELNLQFKKIQNLRYGENPHQKAAYYKFSDADTQCFANSIQLQGKELSYNNILDANVAFSIVKEFETPCVAIVKHNNPCGVACATTVTEAYHNAHFSDSVSAFGGIVACNFKWTSDAARFAADKFVEVLITPGFEEEALKILSIKENLRVLKVNFDLTSHILRLKSKEYKSKYADLKSVDGGLLVQDLDENTVGAEEFQVVTDTQPSKQQIDDLIFSWQIVKNVKSNAIVLVAKRTTVGIGAGQMSRVDSTRIAIEKAKEKVKGSVLASDAFFPFEDAVEIAIRAGVTAIIQPGGSVKDKEVISLCNKFKVPMLFTGKRHFKH
jgi:phosphoribosylaminoimidazolecarboxamide formyltransferase/IMP cyclohydrolase